MKNDCILRCGYFKEWFEGRNPGDNPRDAELIDSALSAGTQCNNTPPTRYIPEGYADCAVLMAARLSIQLTERGIGPETRIEAFYRYFFQEPAGSEL